MDDADYAVMSEAWDSMSADEKEAALGQIVNDTLTEWGYDPVTIDSDSLDGALAQYGDDTVTFDTDTTLAGDPFSEALDTAFHEAAHALNDQDETLFGEDDYDDFNLIDPDSDEAGDFGYVRPEHQNVDDFAETMVDQVREAIGRVAPPTPAGATVPAAVAESGGGSGVPLAEEDFTFEIDFANAEVTGENDFGGFVLDEAGVTVTE